MMLRTKQRDKFLKQKTTETRSAYNKQRNICVSILRKAKRSYFENLAMYLSNVSNISDPVEKAIKKYQKHPIISIIIKMVSSVENEASFSFTCVTVDYISKEIKRLDIKKATQESDVPTKVIKQFPNLYRLLTQKY